MEKTEVQIDEYGTTRFTFALESGIVFTFERELDSALLFVTVKDVDERATTKRIVDTSKTENETILKIYNELISEKENENDDQKSSDD